MRKGICIARTHREKKKKMGDEINVINFDLCPADRGTRLVEFFPDITRCCISGSSGSGKSNVLMSILLHKKPIENVYLCSRTGSQEKYQILKNLIQCYNTEKRKTEKKIGFFECIPENLPSPSDTRENSILIFDDILLDDQKTISAQFLYSRHKNNSLFYLTQAYTKIPKKSGIRANFNFLILFKTDRHNLLQIFYEYASFDIDSFEQFQQMCTSCWSRDRYNFLTIDPENVDRNKRYRVNFSKVFMPPPQLQLCNNNPLITSEEALSNQKNKKGKNKCRKNSREGIGKKIV